MKLNYDCLRKILLTLECGIEWDDNLEYNYVTLAHLSETLEEFSKAEIAYASKMAIEADLIDAQVIDCDSCIVDIRCYGLTYEGHQFLDTVRENKIWKKTKNIINSVGGVSLPVIKNVATDYLTEFIKNRFFR